MTEKQLFAIIPAAGLSQRMGQPKLLLDVAGQTVLERLLAALGQRELSARVIVIRCDDEVLTNQAEKNANLEIVHPEKNPPDMRTSVEHALRFVQDKFEPRPEDGWILLPADHPSLNANLISQLITVWTEQQPVILAPTCQGKRGHPTFFRWSLTNEVFQLPADCGLNRLVRNHQNEILELPVDNSAILADLDTPADYDRLCREFE